MAVTVHSHLIRDGSQEIRYNNSAQLIYARIDRSYFVELDDTTTTDLTTAGNEVLQYCSDYISANTVLPNAGHPTYTSAKAISYQARPWNTSAGAEVIVTFLYDPQWIATTYTVETSSSLMSMIQDWEYTTDTGGKQLLTVDYYQSWTQTSKNGSNTERMAYTDSPSLAGEVKTVGIKTERLFPICNITITKSVNSAKAATLESNMFNYVGYTNNAIFRNWAINCVLCTGITTQAEPSSGLYLARLNFACNLGTWDKPVRITSPMITGGVPDNLWLPTDTKGGNGAKLARIYPRANFNTLVNLL